MGMTDVLHSRDQSSVVALCVLIIVTVTKKIFMFHESSDLYHHKKYLMSIFGKETLLPSCEKGRGVTHTNLGRM